MPTYILRNVKTGEENEEILSISAMEEKVNSGEFVQIHRGHKAPIISQKGSTIRRTSDVYKERLKQIKENSGKNNNINV